MPDTPIDIAQRAVTAKDVVIHIAYVAQQHLDGYEEAVRHVAKRKKAFNKRVSGSQPGERVFKMGMLVQVYCNDLDYMFKTEHKIPPKWSRPYRMVRCIQNLYELAMLGDTQIKGLYHARQLRKFIPRPGTKLARAESEHQ